MPRLPGGAPARSRPAEHKALTALRHRHRARLLAAVGTGGLLLAATALIVTQAPGMGPDDDGMPGFAHRSPRILAAYQYADSPDGDALQWIPCYCGCGAHTGHMNNQDCFVKRDGTGYDEHGSQCVVCVDIALSVRSDLAAGKTLQQARDTVDAQYVGYPPTETPMPP